MTINFVKVVDGEPTGELSLKDPKDGDTWLPFDINLVDPEALKVQAGTIKEDPVKKAAKNARVQKNGDRETAIGGVRGSAIAKFQGLGLTPAEAKAVFGIVPTDGELGI